jgi:hypothetical protein
MNKIKERFGFMMIYLVCSMGFCLATFLFVCGLYDDPFSNSDDVAASS